MGHERIGFLPRTKRWRDIVDSIATAYSGEESAVTNIAAMTIEGVRAKFCHLHEDEGIQAAFGYLLGLATSHLPASYGLASPIGQLEGNPSPARIAIHLNEWVREHAASREYAELACRAASDTIAAWTKAHSSQQSLFAQASSASSIWANASDGRGFCEVSRLFFSNFTHRYLKYFLEREASAQLQTINAREIFSRSLETHLETVGRHAFETSKITQSFAAGWFNRHARERRPSDSDIRGFLALAFGKIHEEMLREAAK